VEHEWSNNGRRRKRKGSASTPREIPSNFSAVVVPMFIWSLAFNVLCNVSALTFDEHFKIPASVILAPLVTSLAGGFCVEVDNVNTAAAPGHLI